MRLTRRIGIISRKLKCMTITSSGSYTLPARTKATFVLIGGGQGGQGATNGKSGARPTISSVNTGSYNIVKTSNYGSYDFTSSEVPWSSVFSEISTSGDSSVITYSGGAIGSGPNAQISQIYRYARYIKISDTECYELKPETINNGYIYYDRLVLTYQGGSGSGTYATFSGTRQGAAGGRPGSGGSGGKVYILDKITITPGASISVTIGSGGSGGSAKASNYTEGNNGSDGGNSSITISGVSYSSQNGNILENGYYDEVNNITYALSGENGVAGGNGGAYTNYNSPESGQSIFGFSGGDPGNNITSTGVYLGGGSGGGAAYGEDGSDGSEPISSTKKSGNGGAGGNASVPLSAASLGSGGNGGNGGGGGGHAGGIYAPTSAGFTPGNGNLGTAGTGGSGSAGSDGANGVILIFYY